MQILSDATTGVQLVRCHQKRQFAKRFKECPGCSHNERIYDNHQERETLEVLRLEWAFMDLLEFWTDMFWENIPVIAIPSKMTFIQQLSC